ncbi:MAG: hypothetical protein PGN26_02795 [Xylophilus ampelinus]
MNLLGALAFFAGFGMLVHVNLGQRDRRFKTGYKNNIVPTQMPLAPRLKWTGGLWAIATLCLVDREVLTFLAVVAALAGGFAGMWVFYPHFQSRFQSSSTSDATFVWARLLMSASIGGMLAYGLQTMLVQPPTPLAHQALNASSSASASEVDTKVLQKVLPQKTDRQTNATTMSLSKEYPVQASEGASTQKNAISNQKNIVESTSATASVTSIAKQNSNMPSEAGAMQRSIAMPRNAWPIEQSAVLGRDIRAEEHLAPTRAQPIDTEAPQEIFDSPPQQAVVIPAAPTAPRR